MGYLQKLADENIDHAVDLYKLETKEAAKIRGKITVLSNELDTVIKKIDPTDPQSLKLQKKRLNKVLKKSRLLINKHFGGIKDSVADVRNKLATIEHEWQISSVNKIFQAELFVNRVPQTALASIASGGLIRGLSQSKWWNKISTNTKDKFEATMREGFVNGDSLSQLTRRIRGSATGKYQKVQIGNKIKSMPKFKGGVLSATTTQAEAMVRTSIMGVANDVRMETIKQNHHVSRGIEQVSTLDNRTTTHCAAYDGGQWDLNRNPIGNTTYDFVALPAHWQCRSTFVPILKPMSEISGGILDDIKGKPNNLRASTWDGKMAAHSNYTDWFKKQTVERQLSILGPGRHKLFKENKLSFKDLVKGNGQAMTLAELEAKVKKMKSGKLADKVGKTVQASSLAQGKKAKEAAKAKAAAEAKAAEAKAAEGAKKAAEDEKFLKFLEDNTNGNEIHQINVAIDHDALAPLVLNKKAGVINRKKLVDETVKKHGATHIESKAAKLTLKIEEEFLETAYKLDNRNKVLTARSIDQLEKANTIPKVQELIINKTAILKEVAEELETMKVNGLPEVQTFGLKIKAKVDKQGLQKANQKINKLVLLEEKKAVADVMAAVSNNSLNDTYIENLKFLVEASSESSSDYYYLKHKYKIAKKEIKNVKPAPAKVTVDDAVIAEQPFGVVEKYKPSQKIVNMEAIDIDTDYQASSARFRTYADSKPYVYNNFNEYTGGVYRRWNYALRSPLGLTELSDLDKQKILTLRHTFNDPKTPRFTGKTYRGLGWMEKKEFTDFIGQIEDQGTIADMKGFISTSTKKGVSEGFASSKYKVYLEIDGKEGVPLLDVSRFSTTETEVLFDHNTRFKVIEIKKKGAYGAKIKLEEIPSYTTAKEIEDTFKNVGKKREVFSKKDLEAKLKGFASHKEFLESEKNGKAFAAKIAKQKKEAEALKKKLAEKKALAKKKLAEAAKKPVFKMQKAQSADFINFPDDDVLKIWNKEFKYNPQQFPKVMGADLPKGVKLEYFADQSGIKIQPDGSFFGRVEMRIRNKKGDMIGKMERHFIITKDGEKYVKHSLLEIFDPKYQGLGLGKKILANSHSLYKKMKIDGIKLTAGLDNGGYAWAKYGFLPDKTSLPSLFSSVKTRMKKAIAKAKKNGMPIPDSTIDLVMNKLDTKDPKSIWDIANLKDPIKKGKHPELGKDLLRGLGWQGGLSYSNKEALKKFEDYINFKNNKIKIVMGG